ETKPQGNVADSPPPASVTSNDKVTTSYLGAWNISWNAKTVVAVSAVAAVSLACIAAVFSGN
ncbi:MAG: hypothetical protein JSS09_03700, partial [Verrucomicrobia bacterium]|nr:hypothetical protein [Verrucomicrobiota bacterium]